MISDGVAVDRLGGRSKTGHLLGQPPACSFSELQRWAWLDALPSRLHSENLVSGASRLGDRGERRGEFRHAPALLACAVPVADLVLTVSPNVDVRVLVARHAHASGLRLLAPHGDDPSVGQAPGC